MGCCNNRLEQTITTNKHRLKKKATFASSKLFNVFTEYRFSNALFNTEENILIYTKERFTKNQFVTLNYLDVETIENSTFKDKNIAISYSKGFKLDSPNQDKFFVIVDGDFEVFCVLDGHGPFGHKIAQAVEEYFFQGVSQWINKEDFKNNNIEILIRDLFKDCQNTLSCRMVRLIFYL